MWDIRKPRAKGVDEKEKRYAIPEQSFEPAIRGAGDAGDTGKGAARDVERPDTENRLNIKVDIHRELLERVNLALIERFSREELARELGPVIDEIIAERSLALNRYEKADLVDEILDELVGLGPLEPLLKDETISDILVNGSETVFVERRGILERAPTRFKDEKHLLRIIQKIVSAVGRRVDEASPFVDARLADGSRVNAIIAPLAIDGSLLSIRKFSKTPISMGRMVEFESLTEEMATLLQAIVQGRLNIIISGGTGSGKTTMLNALSSYINGHERIVTIEDSAELQLQQDHVARLETRPANIEGRGEVNQRDLVRNALRMRPDRIVLGECRSGEAFDMLQAMNTGHDGSMTTVHANTPRDALARIEQMVGMAGLEMSMRTIRAQIVSAINVVIQVGRLPDGRRKTLSISEVTGMEGEVISMQEIFRFRQSGRDADGRVLGQFEATGVRPHFTGVLKSLGIYLDPELFRPTTGFSR
ncbi:MAG: CpaF family protein [Novosphingobium sp.]